MHRWWEMSNMALVTTPDSVLPAVLEAMDRAPDPRLRTVMSALVRHLHELVQEVHLTEAELERGLDFLVALGKATGETKNEAVLVSDILGVSALVTCTCTPGTAGRTTSSGWRTASAGSPWTTPRCSPSW